MAEHFLMGVFYRLSTVKVAENIFYKIEGEASQLIEDVNKFFLCFLLQGNSHKTVATYGYDLLHFFTWLKASDFVFKDIKEFDLYEYIKHQREQKAAPRTINHRLCCVQQFYKFCFGESMPGGRYTLRPVSFYKGQNVPVNMGILPRRRVRKMLRVKVPYKIIQPLDVEEIKNFIRSIKKHRDLAIVYLMLHCGLRSLEILNLKHNDVSYFTREVIIQGKGNKERLVYLPDIVLGILDKYHRYEKPENCDSQYLFVVLKGKIRGQPMTRAGLREVFRYKRKISGIKKANPHRFRHTCGADLVRAGVSLRVIQTILGHENINQTTTYTNIFQKDVREEVFRAYEKMKGRYA
ncbi:MAG: tyrosine-type recombinase/integrase [Deltaproteobacteria bacterium]|nr:tyrosine-type recombinase/integrase [Deltaproteobacteria bacterium]